MTIRPHVKAVKEGEGAVLLDLNEGKYFSLNAVAARIWELVAAGAATDEVVSQLTQSYRIDEVSARRDVDRFFDSMRSRGFVSGE
ncbi:MAG: PqqD family protein [Acidobacteriota bacterium]